MAFAALLSPASLAAQGYPAEGDLPAQPDVVREYTPLTGERLEQMVPKHPGYLGALAPANLAKERPAPPFDLTGTWFVDLSAGFLKFLFGPPYPKFYAEGREALIEAPKAQARGETYRDAIGQCFPPGMPMIMTRVWPHAFIQLPTAVYMISGFNNSVRTIFLDGRQHSDPDLVVPSYNGESIGRWEGDTLVVHSKYFEPDKHYIDYGIPISDAFEIVERIRLVEDGRVMEVEYIMTDPNMWEGEWRSTKRYSRQDYTDINEANCILAYNANLPGTELGRETAEERGTSEIEGVAND
ncbi:hypothetical protein GRI75_09645 [Altererythrobacter soli]|uniref:Uncharacterized protein n=1 Tax=Croceibacterium soli TaxID=1739690 RepID=A0A6I4USL0_9SPHN|nr:hypothetical protein [Croceibacterium soli]MXP41902.1 hypothetical protein [Croceibacterium soli]